MGNGHLFDHLNPVTLAEEPVHDGVKGGLHISAPKREGESEGSAVGSLEDRHGCWYTIRKAASVTGLTMVVKGIDVVQRQEVERGFCVVEEVSRWMLDSLLSRFLFLRLLSSA